GYGDFAGLYNAITVVQEDPCAQNLACVWGFFAGSTVNYGCGGFPAQPAVPYENARGQYISNEIWSPAIPFIGTGNEVILSFDVYKDLPIEALVFFTWRVRSVVAGCPQQWRDRDYVYYGGHKFWLRFSEPIGDLIESGATDIQIALGVVDMFPFWDGIYGDGACHSHSPLFDNVELARVATAGPTWRVRHIDLFQDNFAEDGTTTGTARADMAGDILPPSNPNIVPGDSAVVSVSDPDIGLGVGTNGKADVYCYVRVDGPNGGLVDGTLIDDARYTYIGTVMAGGHPWAKIQMDSSYTAGGSVVADKYNIDLNDNLFVPGDTIHYFFGAEDGSANRTYFSRKLDGQGDDLVTADLPQAGESPMEFTILPAGGWARGGDILYVDHADDRDGPAQIFFDSAFDLLGIRDSVDRYDVLDPSSLGENTLASRVIDVSQQIIACYRKIIWNSGSQERGLI
ncbi:MAG: hypothetical protein KAJ37_05950, partial [Candidatus Krumholzibacteria bacterium]|nr:hypothetical protein [Candidatus Krumholzibacteria bacterium]